MATQRMAAGEPVAAAGSTARENAGSGLAPMTESTTIFSGTGLSSAMGLASSPMANRPRNCGQYGTAWRISRRYNAMSPITYRRNLYRTPN